MLAKKYRYW